MKTSASLFGEAVANAPDRQSQVVRAILAILGLLLSVVGWVRWAF